MGRPRLKPKHRLEIYRGAEGWYWRFICINNKKILAVGAEPFATKHTAHTSFKGVCRVLTIPDKFVVWMEDDRVSSDGMAA